MESQGGWIKLYWKTKDSIAHSCLPSLGMWTALLLRASRKPTYLPDGRKLGAGQLIISEAGFAADVKSSRKVVRRWIDVFEAEGMIKVEQRDHSGTILSICNWSTYQNADSNEGPQRDHSETVLEPQRDHSGTHTESPKSPKSPKKDSIQFQESETKTEEITHPTLGTFYVPANASSPECVESLSRLLEYFGSQAQPPVAMTVQNWFKDISTRDSQKILDMVDRTISRCGRYPYWDDRFGPKDTNGNGSTKTPEKQESVYEDL